MKKLLLFDFDGTLATAEGSIPFETIQELKRLSVNYYIGIISGRTLSFLSGIARQIEIEDIILLGEQGAHIIYPSSLPPEMSLKLSLDNKLMNSLNKIRTTLEDKYGTLIFSHPTFTNLGFFLNKNIDIEEFKLDFLEHIKDYIDLVNIYHQI